jgi:hypothetical protein
VRTAGRRIASGAAEEHTEIRGLNRVQSHGYGLRKDGSSVACLQQANHGMTKIDVEDWRASQGTGFAGLISVV